MNWSQNEFLKENDVTVPFPLRHWWRRRVKEARGRCHAGGPVRVRGPRKSSVPFSSLSGLCGESSSLWRALTQVRQLLITTYIYLYITLKYREKILKLWSVYSAEPRGVFFFFVLFHVGVHSFIHDAMFRVAQHLRRYIIRLSVIRLSQNLEEKKERKKNTFTFFQAARSFFSFSFLFCVCVAPARDTCTSSGKQLRLMHSARVKAVLPNASYRNTFYESRYVWGYLGLLRMRQQNISDI